MDETIPIPERPIDKTFMMSVDSTFTIPGRGTVVTGTIEQGRVKVGEDIEIVGYSDKSTKTTVTGNLKLFNSEIQALKRSEKVSKWAKLGITVESC